MKTKTHHTPGPWKAGTGWVLGPANQAKPAICYKTSTPNSLDQDEANLRLIAAAPDLLAALKDALVACGEGGLDVLDDGSGTDWEWVKVAEAAIAKAGGR